MKILLTLGERLRSIAGELQPARLVSRGNGYQWACCNSEVGLLNVSLVDDCYSTSSRGDSERMVSGIRLNWRQLAEVAGHIPNRPEERWFPDQGACCIYPSDLQTSSAHRPLGRLALELDQRLLRDRLRLVEGSSKITILVDLFDSFSTGLVIPLLRILTKQEFEEIRLCAVLYPDVDLADPRQKLPAAGAYAFLLELLHAVGIRKMRLRPSSKIAIEVVAHDPLLLWPKIQLTDSRSKRATVLPPADVPGVGCRFVFNQTVQSHATVSLTVGEERQTVLEKSLDRVLLSEFRKQVERNANSESSSPDCNEVSSVGLEVTVQDYLESASEKCLEHLEHLVNLEDRNRKADTTSRGLDEHADALSSLVQLGDLLISRSDTTESADEKFFARLLDAPGFEQLEAYVLEPMTSDRGRLEKVRRSLAAKRNDSPYGRLDRVSRLWRLSAPPPNTFLQRAMRPLTGKLEQEMSTHTRLGVLKQIVRPNPELLDNALTKPAELSHLIDEYEALHSRLKSKLEDFVRKSLLEETILRLESARKEAKKEAQSLSQRLGYWQEPESDTAEEVDPKYHSWIQQYVARHYGNFVDAIKESPETNHRISAIVDEAVQDFRSDFPDETWQNRLQKCLDDLTLPFGSAKLADIHRVVVILLPNDDLGFDKDQAKKVVSTVEDRFNTKPHVLGTSHREVVIHLAESGHRIENLRILPEIRRAYLKLGDAKQCVLTDKRYLDCPEFQSLDLLPGEPIDPVVVCGNANCCGDITTLPRETRFCPHCKRIILSRCHNADCSQDQLHKESYALGRTCQACGGPNGAAFWLCPNHGKDQHYVSNGEKQCDRCVRESADPEHPRTSEEIGQRPELELSKQEPSSQAN